jgi:aminobenzoyl-glutamate transport protein
MAGMGPYIVLAFFAAQFVAYFSHSRLGEMLAIAGGAALAQADLPTPALVGAFIGVVAAGNLAIGSMSAKYAFFAPVFVPMFMQVGISPELTQAAYRVGDSVTNVITPLNPYVVIILVFMQRWVPKAGIGSLVALMLPYAIAFGVTWSALLLVWVALGWPLGPAGPLVYAGTALAQ